jgi:serine/threonine protein kinase
MGLMGSAPELQRIGKYELVRRIGRGGMGDVWLARHRGPAGFERQVALKVLPRGQSPKSQLFRRLSREARVVGKLDHPNIVSLHDFDQDVESEAIFLAMEHVEGLDCQRIMSLLRLQGGVGLDLSLIIYIAQECLAALGYAHDLTNDDGTPLGLVHRDVTPSNILCSVSGRVKITDFGIAKSRNLSIATTEDLLVGKIPYMSPEQIDDEEIDHRSDLWSLGVVLHELCTGQRLFRGGTPVERMAQVLGADTPPIRRFRPSFPQWFEELIQGFLQRDPQSRHPSAAEALGILLRSTGPLVATEGSELLGRLVTALRQEEDAVPQESLSASQTRSPVGSGMASTPEGSSPPGRDRPAESGDEEDVAYAKTQTVESCSSRAPGDSSTPLAIPSGRADHQVEGSVEGEVGADAPGQPPSDEGDRRDATPRRHPTLSREQTLPRWRRGEEENEEPPPERRGGPRYTFDDVVEPRACAMSVWRYVAPWGEAANGEHHLLMRGLPESLTSETNRLDDYRRALKRARDIAGVTPGFLRRALPTFGGMVGAEQFPPLGASFEGKSTELYQEIIEPECMTLDDYLSHQLKLTLPQDLARLRANEDEPAELGPDTGRWLAFRFRVECGLAVCRRLLQGLAEWHGAGGFHGALTPEAILVRVMSRPALDDSIKRECWKRRVWCATECTVWPKMCDVGLRGPWEAELSELLSCYSLSFRQGRIQGELGDLAPEEIDTALQTVAHPLRLYSPPEVVRGEEQPGPATDLFFCGLLLFEVIAGRYPFRERSHYTSLSRMLDPENRPVAVTKYNPFVSDRLAEVIHKALDKDPGRRFRAASELLVELEEASLDYGEVEGG